MMAQQGLIILLGLITIGTSEFTNSIQIEKGQVYSLVKNFGQSESGSQSVYYSFNSSHFIRANCTYFAYSNGCDRNEVSMSKNYIDSQNLLISSCGWISFSKTGLQKLKITFDKSLITTDAIVKCLVDTYEFSAIVGKSPN